MTMPDYDIYRSLPAQERDELGFARWKELQRIGTHGPGCFAFGRSHYECAMREIERLQVDISKMETAALLALGILWMDERVTDKTHTAYQILRDALGGKEALRKGIEAAISAGYEADHPQGADGWAGKKSEIVQLRAAMADKGEGR